jgi:predicted exporter
VHSPLQQIVVLAHRRRAAVLALAAVLAALSLIGVARLSFDTNVLELLPRSGTAIPAFRVLAERFAAGEQLFVVLTVPDGHDVADYRDDVDAVAEALAAVPGIASVDAGTGIGRDWNWLADRQLLLLDPERLDAALGRLEPGGIEPAMRSTRELLALGSAEIEAMVQQDPLDLFSLLRAQLAGPAGSGFAGAGGYRSVDGRRRLLLARPERPPYDSDFSAALMQQLESLRARVPAPLEIEIAGGHRIAVETERIVKRESVLSSVISLALILPLLFVAFRSFWLVAFGAVPAALSLLVVFGAMGLAGVTLSAAAAGSAAMLFGLGVDGVVLLYVSHRLAVQRGAGGEAAIAATSGPSASMLLGMFTTAASFYGLYFVDFPSMRQLGVIIGHAMVACGLLTLVLVPALLPSRVRATARRSSWPALAAWIGRRRPVILATAALVTVALALALPTLRVNPSLERLRSQTPGVAVERQVASEFALPGEALAILQTGPELDPLLEQNRLMAERLRRALPGLTLQVPSTMLPSRKSQEAALARIDAAGLSEAAVGADVRQAADALGFQPGTFDPFLGRLPGLLHPQIITLDEYRAHGFDDIMSRLISEAGGEWTLASYVFPGDAEALAQVREAVADVEGARLTGTALVNEELSDRFLPEFLKGLAIGSFIVVVMIAWTFRNWRLSLLALVPTALGLTWSAGLLALARVELDLFAIFTVVTFVGIGIDYGIHMVHRYQEHGRADVAVADLAPVIVVAGAITLMGYGTLVTSSYPPLQSMGAVSLVSVVTLVVASVLVLPALLTREPS